MSPITIEGENLTFSQKTDDEVDVETKSPNLVTIPIPELPLGTQFVEFEYGGQVYRYPSRQAQCSNQDVVSYTSGPVANHIGRTASLSPTSAVGKESAEGNDLDEDITPQTPSLGEDEDDESEDSSGDITDFVNMCFSTSSASILAAPKSDPVLCGKMWDTGLVIPEIHLEECEDPEPICDDIKDTTLSAALSVNNLALDFLSVPHRSCYAPRPKPEPTLALGESFDDDSDDSDDDDDALLLSTGRYVQRTRSFATVVLNVNHDGFRRPFRSANAMDNTHLNRSLAPIFE